MADPENNIRKLLRIYCAPMQALEDCLQQMLTERSVGTAVGAQLDLVGKIVGQDRIGLDDDAYRRYIRARISANKSDGLIEDLILVAKLLIDDLVASIVIDNQGIATVVLRVEDLPVSEALADILITFLLTTKAGGVRVILESSAEAVVDWLVLDVGHLDTESMISARDHVLG